MENVKPPKSKTAIEIEKINNKLDSEIALAQSKRNLLEKEKLDLEKLILKVKNVIGKLKEKRWFQKILWSEFLRKRRIENKLRELSIRFHYIQDIIDKIDNDIKELEKKANQEIYKIYEQEKATLKFFYNRSSEGNWWHYNRE